MGTYEAELPPVGTKVLYYAEVYYFRGLDKDGRALLSLNIDGQTTLSVSASSVRVVKGL